MVFGGQIRDNSDHYLSCSLGCMRPSSSSSLTKLRQDIRFSCPLAGVEMQFVTTWGLFSPRAVDAGSALLLNAISVNAEDNILDLGCGYGPLGLTLAKLAPAGQTLMVDKDFVAVDYCHRNMVLNQLNNCSARLSNGFDQIREYKFDLIVSNLPAKVGNEMLWLMLDDAFQQLTPNGRLVVVTIAGLSRFIKREFKLKFGNYKKLKQGKTYTVAQAIKTQSQ